jgi:hypothetical protein
MREWVQPRNCSPVEAAWQGLFSVPSVFPLTRGRCLLGRNEYEHQTDTAGYGPRRLYKDCRDNVGNHRLSAGARGSPQRLAVQGKPEVSERVSVGRMSP